MPADLNSVMPLITTEHIRALMIELVHVPSPLTEKLEAEPKLREFIDIAVERRLRKMGLTDIRRDGMGNLLATLGRGESGRSLMLVTNAMTQPGETDGMTGLEILMFVLDHTTHHRASAEMYLRAKGITPAEYQF